MKARIWLLTTCVMLTVILLTQLVPFVAITQALPIWTANDGQRGFDTTTLRGRTESDVTRPLVSSTSSLHSLGEPAAVEGGSPDGGLKFYVPSSQEFLPLVVRDSASTASPTADIISMSRIKSGDYVPIVVKLLKEDGAVNSDISGDFKLLSETANLISDTISIKMGMGSITTQIDSNDDFQISLEGFAGHRSVEVEDNIPSISYSGTITTSETWFSDSHYYIRENFIITDGVELIIKEGASIFLSENVNIFVHGTINVQGSKSDPVSFVSEEHDKPWGGIEILNPTQTSYFEYAFFINGGGDDRVFGHSNSQPVIKAVGSYMEILNCFMIDNIGKALGSLTSKVNISDSLISRSDMGGEFVKSLLTISNTHVYDIPTDKKITVDDETEDNDAFHFTGVYPHSSESSVISHSVFVNGLDDGVDSNGAMLSILDSFFYYFADKGVSVGTSRRVSLERNVIVGCAKGVSVKDDAYVYLDRNTLYNNDVSVECRKKNAPGGGMAKVINTILANSSDTSYTVDDTSILTISYSLSNTDPLPGDGNILAEPLFVNPSAKNFQLAPNSPAIDAGDPNSSFDPDGTRADMGAYSRTHIPPDTPLGSAIPITTSADGANSVYSADLDSDGDLDVISGDDGHIVWYENKGASFAASHVISTNGAYSIFATDVDGDGDIDILSAARDRDQIAWYENDGGAPPTFTSHVVSTDASDPRQIYAADVDGDGDMDLLSASRNDNKIAWYENNGASLPIFSPHVITNSAIGAVSVHTADMDGDGDMDVLSASQLDNKIAWYENHNGQPPDFTTHVISEQQILEEGAHSVYAADADGDGDMDVFYVSENEGQNGGQIAWFENTGGSPLAFTEHIISTDVNMQPKEIYAADIDSDGDIDALSAADEVAWHQNNGTSPPTFSSIVVTTDTQYADSVYAADLDRDGDLDLLSASKDDDKVAWYPNNTIHRSAAFPVQSVINTVDRVRSVYAADMNKDGDLDVLSVSENQVTWYENNGTSPLAFTTHLISTDLAGGRWVYTADLDSDGDQDVLSASLTKIAWHENDGNPSPTFTSHLVSNDIDKGRSVHAADLDRDGDLDVFSSSSLDDKVAWYENDGGSPPTFITHIITTNADKVRSAYAADMDGDGDIDLLSASQDDDTVAWYENDGGESPVFTSHIIATDADGAQSVHAADVDGDGDIDVLSCSEHDNKIAWYENDGAPRPTFTTHIVSTNAPGVHAVYTGDADGDGDLDLFAAIEYNDTIAWYENDGNSPPLFTSQVITDTADVAHATYAADLDHDGDLDVLSASRGDGKIAWYENRGGQFGLLTTDTAPEVILVEEQDDVLQIVATHRGRLGDTDVELTAFELLFEDHLGNPLSTSQVNNLLEKLHIYRDDGSGRFEATTDTLVTTVSPLSLTPTGQQTVTFVDGDPNVQVRFGTPITYFVVVELTPDAAYQTPNRFRVTHLVANSTAEDRENDMPLEAEFSQNVTSGISTAITFRFVINEFMASNQTTLEDPDEAGAFPDWIEIHNVGTREADLSGLYLTDDLSDPTKFKISPNTIVPAGGFVLFYADNQPEQGAFHTNFTLSQNGGTIGLFSDTAQIDAYTFGPQVADLSEGRYPDGADNWRSFSVPTPGEPNLLISPTTSNVMHTPAQPMATDIVTVTATIIDDGLLLTTTLYYTTTEGSTAVPMVWQGNDLYAAQIPPQPDGSLVQYYVLAEDNDGLSSNSNPLDAPNELYQYLVGNEPPTLLINEFMAKNSTTLEDPDEPSSFPDWIELYNPTSTPIELGGMYLTDHFSETTKFRITDSLSIPAKGFVLFYADGQVEQGPLHTNFKLSKEGESLGLFSSDATGNQPIDTYTFGAQTADVSEGRDPDGEDNWRLFSVSTPGESNVPRTLIISHVTHTPTLPIGSDMVTVSATITSQGTLLTTTLYYTTPGNGTIAVPMTSSSNEQYVAQIPAQPDDTLVQYYILAEDSDAQSSTAPPNAPTDFYKYLVGYQPPSLLINEFMAENTTTLEDPDEPGDFPDWIELYNPSSTPIELGGMYLADGFNNPTKFRITDSLSIPAEGFLLFYADDQIEQGPLHTNFKLSKEGERIGLFSSDATGNYPIDTYTFGTQTADQSEGRDPDDQHNWRLFSVSTPGESNLFTFWQTYFPIVHK